MPILCDRCRTRKDNARVTPGYPRPLCDACWAKLPRDRVTGEVRQCGGK